jgi:predicted RNase H-like HicB family nuclease
MKVCYPVIIDTKDFVVFIPDLQINTEGDNLADAISMARDAISLWCVCREDDNLELPIATTLNAISVQQDQIITLVDADLDAYREFLSIEERREVLLATYPEPDPIRSRRRETVFA